MTSKFRLVPSEPRFAESRDDFDAQAQNIACFSGMFMAAYGASLRYQKGQAQRRELDGIIDNLADLIEARRRLNNEILHAHYQRHVYSCRTGAH